MKNLSVRKFFHSILIENGMAVFLCFIVCFALFSNYADIQCSDMQAQIAKSLDDKAHTKHILFRFYLMKGLMLFVESISYYLIIFVIANAHKNGILGFFLQYLNLKYPIFNSIGMGIIHHTIERRAKALVELLTALLVHLLSNSFFMLLTFEAIRSEIHPPAGRKILILLTIYLTLISLARKHRARFRNRINKESELSSVLCYDILNNYERIKAFESTKNEIEKFYRVLGKGLYYNIIYEVSYVMLEFLNMIILLIITYYVLLSFLESNASEKDVSTLFLLISKMQDVISEVSKDIDNAFVSYSNFSMSNTVDTDYEESGGKCMYSFMSSIKLVDVAHERNGFTLLQGINCEILHRQKVAVVGPSGSGKSTFLKILLKFYEYSGSIKVDGFELREIERKSLYRLVAYVPQSSDLFGRAVYKNLWDGNPEAKPQDVLADCKEFGYHKVFRELKYSKNVGVKGTNISGGQRQKICLMRALIKKAPIMLLDRPCESMDSVSAAEVDEMILSRTPEVTIINVVDNLSTLDRYDLILYIGGVSSVEVGSFKDLMANGSDFSSFYKDSKVSKRECVS